jgi:uncharacterized protein YjbI with pentapeptide repeats
MSCRLRDDPKMHQAADFSEFDFGCQILRGVSFFNCVLRGVRFQSAVLDEVYFEDCDFTRARFIATTFDGTGFFGCRLERARFVGCDGVVFAGSALEFARARIEASAMEFISLQAIELEPGRWKAVSLPAEVVKGRLVESQRVQVLGEIRRLDSP